MTLSELQVAFWGLVADGGELEEAQELFVSTPRLAAAERMAIYADMFVDRQVSCLLDDFPKLARLLGAEAFETVARAYIAAHPSRHHSLATLGRELPRFLALRGDSRRDASELAALEWARAEVFEEADAEVATAPSAWDRPLPIVPALRILSLQHDVLALWEALEHESPALPVSARPVTVVVWRKQFEVFHVGLAADEAEALQRAVAGHALDSVCAAFEARADPLAAAVRAIGSWFSEGFIADAHTTEGTQT